MTGRQLAHFLKNEHAKRSWKEISTEHYSGLVPAGTLSRIAKTDGQYIPKKWATVLKTARTTRRAPRRLADMSANELAWCLNNRKEM